MPIKNSILSKQQFVAYKSRKENDCYLEDIRQNVSRKKRQPKIFYASTALTKLEVIISYMTRNCYKSRCTTFLCLFKNLYVCLFRNIRIMFPAVSIVVNLLSNKLSKFKICSIKVSLSSEFNFRIFYNENYIVTGA